MFKYCKCSTIMKRLRYFCSRFPAENANEIIDHSKVFQLQQIHMIINPRIIAKDPLTEQKSQRLDKKNL